MQMTGEQHIAASRQAVWDALNDPRVLGQCIPGCQSLEQESPERLRAVAEIKIGPIGARFNGAVDLSDLDPPNGYTITGEGQGGTAGFAKGGAKVRLADENGGTRLTYDVDAQVGGRLAQLGGPIIDATAKQMAGQFFKKFGEVVEAPAQPEPVAAEAGAAPARAAYAPAYVRPPAPAKAGTPVAWLLALVVAALAGFLVGRGQAEVAGSDWVGLAIGLLVVVVAGAGFQFGRRAGAQTVVIDSDVLARLIEGARR